jgi:RNA 2',3'-cyclic 3'-phosphodiesterase
LPKKEALKLLEANPLPIFGVGVLHSGVFVPRYSNMQRKRIFVAINLPKKVREKLAEYRFDVPAKWTKTENLHITLNFLGQVEDEDLLDIFSAVQEAALNNSPFDLNFDKIAYGSKYKMIWAVGKSTPSLANLKKDLDKKLSSDNKGFSPHITLARIKMWEFRSIDPEDRPQVEKNIDLNFEVDSIEVMESVLKKEGPEYTVLQSYRLN